MRLSGTRTRIRNRQKPVLIVQHAPHEHPAIIRRSLETQGLPTLWIHAYKGDKYPALEDIQGIISLGGPMGANDEEKHPWIKDECALLKACALSGMPVVGVCLGGQMLARALGGDVVKNHVAEVGWFPIEVNREGLADPILGNAGGNPLVYHWHFDTFSLPAGATLLASSPACFRQAYRVGERAYGFQFHPEADHQLLHEWLETEGIEEEINEAQIEYGRSSVQDSDTQRARSTQGEKSSLKITAGIGQLFLVKTYQPVSCDFYDQLEAAAVFRTHIQLDFDGSDGRTRQLRGQIVMLFTIRDAEFVVFREDNTELWPIRMDYIKKMKNT